VKIIYGMDVQAKDDFYVRNAEIALSGLAAAGNPGSFLVDMFPAMKYIPEWFPGASWKRKGNWWRQITSLVVSNPWKQVREQMVSHIHFFPVTLTP
jgi:hypothetical protein